MKRTCVYAAAALSIFSSFSFAQGAGGPLSMQGYDRRALYDVRSRGMGGAVLAAGTNASMLFVNPAGLTAVGSLEIRIAGIGASTSQRQTQQWVPNRLYTGLSLLMEDKWGDIKAPASTDPWEQLQKPFDTIGPNWSRKTSRTIPLSVAIAMPLELAEIPFVFGIGGSRGIDLDHFFQNNNVTDPNLGQYRPAPLPELGSGDTLRVRWYQLTRDQMGSIWGITPAVGVSLFGVSIGASATIYTGTSDDVERRLDRGFLTFAPSRFRVQDTVHFASVRSGSSTYSGFGGTFGVRVDQPRYSVAATLELPYTLKNKYSRKFHSREDIILDRTQNTAQTTIFDSTDAGTEKIHFPLAYSLGVLLKPFPLWAIGFDYELRALNQVTYTLKDGTVLKPWVGASSFRLGAEYRLNDWLALRAGYREVPQSFSPEGAAIIGDPAVMTVYTAGAGFSVYGMEIDAGYEYARLRYQDSWQSNVNYNTFTQHRVLVEIGYHPLGAPNE